MAPNKKQSADHRTDKEKAWIAAFGGGVVAALALAGSLGVAYLESDGGCPTTFEIAEADEPFKELKPEERAAVNAALADKLKECLK